MSNLGASAEYSALKCWPGMVPCHRHWLDTIPEAEAGGAPRPGLLIGQRDVCL